MVNLVMITSHDEIEKIVLRVEMEMMLFTDKMATIIYHDITVQIGYRDDHEQMYLRDDLVPILVLISMQMNEILRYMKVSGIYLVIVVIVVIDDLLV